MFERVLFSVLTRFLGEYVEDSTFSAESLKLGIWRGYLVLEDMHIKKSFLDTLELPLTLKHGIIGRFEMRIPWSSLHKDPIIVDIDRVFLVVEPKFEWDAGAVKRRERAAKSAKIAAAELFRMSPLLDDTSAGPTEGAGKARWGSGVQKWVTDRLITRIVDSLQIHVRDVHVRYEDHLSHPKMPFYVGVTLESLQVDSTDQGWEVQPSPRSGPLSSSREAAADPTGGGGGGGASAGPPSVDAASGAQKGAAAAAAAGDSCGDPLVKKNLQLTQLAVYWNPAEDGNPCSMHLSDIPVEQAEVVISRLIARKDEVDALVAGEGAAGGSGKMRHRYILEPVDASARVALSVDPMDRSQPRLQAQVDVGRMSSRLEDFQVQGAMCLGAALAQYGEVGKYSKHRPEVAVVIDPVSWWHYAFTVVVEKLRAERCWRARFPDIVKRRKLRLEYVPLWKKSLGLSVADENGDEDGDGDQGIDSPSPRFSTPSSSEFPGGGHSPNSTVSSPAVSSARFRSGVDSSGDDVVDAEASVWLTGLGGQRRTTRRARARKRRASAQAEALAAKERLEGLEDELSFEDIIIFRAMAEREEALRSDRGRKSNENSWGIGGWVSWAMGTGIRSVPGEEEEEENTEDNFRRLFTAIDFDPSRAPPPPPLEGEASGPANWGGWLAASLNLRAPEGTLVLAGSGASAGKIPVMLSKQPEAKDFMAFRFGGFGLCAELHGEEMDGILASATLDDLGVYEMDVDNSRLHDPNFAYGHGGTVSHEEAGVGRSPIVSRRSVSAKRGAGSIGERLTGGQRGEDSLLPPLFEVHFEMNPRDPDYDSKVYLALDQVETVLSPSAKWLTDITAFVQAPEGLENRAKLELAATNQLNSLRMQLESRMEMVVSNRFRTFLDLNVKAPLVVIPVDLDLPSNSSAKCRGVVHTERDLSGNNERGDGKQENNIEGRQQEEKDYRGRGAGSAKGAAGGEYSTGGTIPGSVERVSLSHSSSSPAPSSPAAERGLDLQRTPSAAAVVNELLVVDLGSLSLTTARLAHLQRDTDRREAGEASKGTNNVGGGGSGSGSGSGGGGSSSNGEVAGGKEGEGGVDNDGSEQPPDRGQRRREQGRDQGRGDASGREAQSMTTPRLSRAGSSVDVGPGVERQGAGEGWHANLYDVYNVEVRQVGVLLARRGVDNDDGELCSGGWWRGSVDEVGWVAGRGGAAHGRGEDAGRWLVNPFDVKVELHLSVMQEDPAVSQLKIYGDLPRLHVRLSQGKLQRLAAMSAAIAAQSAALDASPAAINRSPGIDNPSAERKRRDGTSDASGGGGGMSSSVPSFSTFLEYQRSMSQRFDQLHQASDSATPGAAPPRHRDLGRYRLSEQSLGWGGGSSGLGGCNDSEDFASAWGGSSLSGSTHGSAGRGRGTGGISSKASTGSSAYHIARSQSGESEFYDATDGEDSPVWSEAVSSPSPSPGPEAAASSPAAAAAAAAGVAAGVAVPQPGGEETGSGEQGWNVGSLLDNEGGAPGGNKTSSGGGEGDSESDFLEFQDARDPVSEMDDALMAKEAEKADLMKRRQKFRGQLASSRLTGAELERVRVASAEVSKSLELCEDELKDLGAALEEITEAFEEAARRTQQQLDINNSGLLSPVRGNATEGASVGGNSKAHPSSPFFPPPSGRGGRSLPPNLGRAAGAPLPGRQAEPAGPNREVIMCGLTVPIIQVDLLQDKSASAVRTRRREAPPGLGRLGGETDGEGRTVRGWGAAEGVTGQGDDAQEEQEEQVVSLRLVGLGMQLHSKSYSARFSFSMQDLDLEDCLHTSANANATKGFASSAASGTVTGVGMAQEDAPTAQLRPAETAEALAEPLQSGSENGEESAGNMATSRPRLFLWQRTDGRGPPRRVVTFHDGSARDGEGKSSGVAASAADKGHEETKRSEIVPEVPDREEDRAAGEAGKRSGQLSRADFIQLSYAMKNVPSRGDTGGVGSSEGVMCRGAWRGQETHRVKLVVGAIEVALEQETIMTVLRIASSVLVDSPPPPPSPLVTPAAAVPSGSMSVPATPRSEPCAETATGVLPAGDSDGGGSELAMPMLPCGVSVTLAVDFAAMSVVLTNARKNVIAVTFGAAHCKVNTEEKRVKAVMSLGDFYVLNLLRPAQRSPSLGFPSANTAAACPEGGSLWADPVVGRREGAVGPVVDVALVVVSSADRVFFSDVERDTARVVGVGGASDCGLEARVKIRLDSIRTVFSIPFVENLTRHVLAGPLLSPWLHNTESIQQTGSVGPDASSPAPPSAPPPNTATLSDDGAQVVAADDGDVWELAAPFDVGHAEGGGSLSWESAEDVATRWQGAGDAPQDTLEEEERWKHFIYIKVGVEVCDFAVDAPFDGDIDNTGRINQVTAEVGHLLASTTWTLPTVDGGGGGESSSDKDKHPGILYVETLVSSAAVKAGPESFELLQAMHVRTVTTVPLGRGTVLASCVDGRSFRGIASDSERDELAEKAQERANRGPVTAPLPARPDLWREDSIGGVGSRGGGVSERIHMGVTVSPIRLNLTEPHLLGLTCFALDTSARLAEISEFFSASPVQEQATHGEDEPTSGETPFDVASDDRDLEEQAPRPNASVASRSIRTSATGFDSTKAAGNGGRAMAASSRPSSLVSTAPTRGGRSREASATAESSPPRSSELEPTVGKRESQQEAGVSARDSRGPGGSPPTDEGALDGALSDEELREQLPGESEPPAARPDGLEEAPIPPAFLGTLIIDAISVMLLKDAGRASGAAGVTAYSGGSVGVGSAQHPGATGVSTGLSCPPPPASIHHEPYDQGARATSPPNQPHSPVTLLEVHGIGIGVDLPQQSPPLESGQPLTEDAPPAEGIGGGCEHRAELAIKSVSVTDVSGGRRVSLAHAVRERASVGGAGIQRGHEGNSRVLPAGWWGHSEDRDASGDTSGYGEQVLLQVRMCTTSSTASVDANLAPGCLWLLPAPVLDVADLVACLRRDVVDYSRCRDAGREGGGDRDVGRRNVPSPPEVRGQSGARDGASPLETPLMRSGDAYRLEPWMLRTDSLRGDLDIGRVREAPSIPPVLSLPWEVAGGRVGVLDGETSPVRRQNGANEPRPTKHRSWRQITRALSGTAVPDFLWLKRIDVSVSAYGLQLWLPNVESGNGAVGVAAARHAEGIASAAGSAAAVGQNVPGFEAIVVSCRSCHLALSVAVSMLSDDAISGPVEDLAATTPDEGVSGARLAEVGSEDADHDSGLAAEGSAVGGDGVVGDAAAGEAAEAAALIGSGNELCVMSVGLHGLEVFVARPSMEDSGAPVEPPVGLRGDLDGESGERAPHLGAARSPHNPPPAMDTVSRGQVESAGNAVVGTETQNRVSGTSSCRQRKPSDDPARWPTDQSGSGTLSDVVSESDVSVEVSAAGSAFEDGGGGRSLRDCSSNTEALIFPFSVDLKHALLVHPPLSASGPDPPLLSEMKVSVTAVQAVLFLDFPLAARIMESSLGPLLKGVSSFTEGSQGRDDDGCGDRSRQACTGDGKQGGRRQDNVSAEAQGDSPVPVRGSVGVLRVPGAPPSSGGDDRSREDDTPMEAVLAAPAPAPAVASELMAMWACRVGIEAGGLRMKVVNNFYLQNRPSVKINVQSIAGELTASGAAQSLQARLSAKIESDFYNAKLMAWEPLMELWGASLELETDIGTPNDQTLSRSAEGVPGWSSAGGGDSRGSQRQAAGSFYGISGHVRELAMQEERRARGVDRPAAVIVGLRLVSDEVLNLNLTESLVENLAAIVHAQQRKEGKLGGTWAGGGSDDDRFSLHWLRNETGLPITCSAHCDAGHGRSFDGQVDVDAAVPVQVPVGEEAPMPLLTATATFASRARGSGSLASVVDETVATAEGVTATHSEQPAYRLQETSRASFDSGRWSGTRRSRSSAGSREEASGRRRRRPVRAVILAYENGHEQGVVCSAVAQTSWRSLIPIDVDIVGQRLVTMVASRTRESFSNNPGTADSSDRGAWGLGARAATLASTSAQRARTVKVVTEVESHHGVKVLRVRSQVEIANSMDDLCMHVGIVGENDARGRRSSNGGPRFEWETVISPGSTCPVPATMATSLVGGRALLVVKPVLRRTSGTEPVVLSSSSEAVSGQAQDVPGPASADEFEEAILALPDPTEWERETTENAHYHQTLEFSPIPTSCRGATRGSAGFTPGSGPARGSRLSGKSIFCGVSAARQQAQGVERNGGRSRGRAGQVTVLSFEPTLSLTNLLAARADVRLSCRALTEGTSTVRDPSALPVTGVLEADTGRVWSGPIERGTEVAWLHCPPGEEVTMAVRMEGFGWSDAVTLPLPPPARHFDGGSPEPGTAARRDTQSAETGAANRASPADASPPQQLWRKRLAAGSRLWGGVAPGRAEKSHEKVHVELRDAEGGVLRVNAEVAFTASGLRQVSLWVPYWVVNTTSLPLTLQHYASALSGSAHDGGFLRHGGATAPQLQLPPAYASSTAEASITRATFEAASDAEDNTAAADRERRSEDAGVSQRRAWARARGDEYGDGVQLGVGVGTGAIATLARASSKDPGLVKAAGPGPQSPKLFSQPPQLGLKFLVEEEKRELDQSRAYAGEETKGSFQEEEKGEDRGGAVTEDEEYMRSPLMLSHDNSEQRVERVRVRLEGSTWSVPFGLDQDWDGESLEVSGKPTTASSQGRQVAGRWGAARRHRRRAERQAFPVGVSVKAAPAPFGRTKVVALTPRYILVNATGRAIEVQQAGLGEGVEPFKVGSDARAAFHWPREGAGGWFGGAAVAGAKNRRLVLRFCGQGWDWSGEILPESGEESTLRVRNGQTREVAFVRVGVSTKESSVHLVFRNELPSFAPYRIDNFSLATLRLRQVGGKVAETLLPYQTCPYSWDEPLGERAVIVERMAGVPAGATPLGRRSGRTNAIAADADDAAAEGVGSGTPRRASVRSGGGDGSGEDVSGVFIGVYGLDLMRPSTVVGNIRIDMMVDGPTRVIRFTDARSASVSSQQDRSSSNDNARLGLTNVSSRPPPELSSGVSLEATVRIAGVGVSVIDASPRELLYLTVGGISLDYLREGQGERVRVNVSKLQIDNQLVVTPYPALLYPITEALPPRHAAVNRSAAPSFPSLPLRRGVGSSLAGVESDQTCFEAILHRDLGYSWVNFVRLASVRLAPLDVNIDMALVDALLEVSARVIDLVGVEPPLPPGTAFSSSDFTSTPPTAAGATLTDLLDIPRPPELNGEAVSTGGTDSAPLKKLYVEELAVSPIRLHVSLTSSSSGGLLEHLLPPEKDASSTLSADGGRASGGRSAAVALAVLRAMGTTIIEIENAPLWLNSLVVSHAFTSPEELLQKLVLHYRGQALRQGLRVLGSSKLLGSPLGLFSNISAGIKDFFYEPVVGLSQSPLGFVVGVYKGTSSLVRRTLYSVTDTTDRIASSVSSGILASGAVDVLVRGGRGVVRPYGALDGVMLGVAGAVREPFIGLRSGGFAGMTTGLFTGWVGLVLRPMYGTLMSTSQLCQVISGHLDPRLDSEQKLRMLRTRPPRFFRSREQALSVYSREENIGEELLSRVFMGRYRSDGYVWHVAVKDMIVLVTGRRVLMLHGDAAGVNRNVATTRRHTYGVVEWEVEFDLVVLVEAEEGAGNERGENATGGSASDSDGRRAFEGRTEGVHGTDGDGFGASLSVYHFPDPCVEGKGDGRAGGKALAALRFEQRTVLCADWTQALQIRKVLLEQVPSLSSTRSTRTEGLDSAGSRRRRDRGDAEAVAGLS